MTAKATGEQVRIATYGCIATPVGVVPKLEWLDVGLHSASVTGI